METEVPDSPALSWGGRFSSSDTSFPRSRYWRKNTQR